MIDMKATRRAIALLGAHRSELSRQQIKSLRGQVLAGDIDGATRGLNTILTRKAKKKKEVQHGIHD